jgi:hypothetical protein
MFKPFGKKGRGTSIRALHEPTEDRLEQLAGFPKVGKGKPVFPHPPNLKPVTFKRPRRG